MTTDKETMGTPAGRPLPIRLQTDREGVVDLAFVEELGSIFVIPSRGRSSWVSDVLEAGGCWVERTPEARERRSAGLVTDPEEADRVRARFREKYGTSRYERYFAGAAKVIRLGSGEEALPPTYADRLRHEFDAVAPRYSASVEANPVARYLRAGSVAALLPLMADSDPLLEIGSGTGAETLPLLAAGHHVTAVDISERMLEQLALRAKAAGTGARLSVRVGAAGELESTSRDLPDGHFGGAYSTFGALNLEPSLEPVARALGRLLRPGSPFFAVVINRWALPPILYNVAAGHLRQARARLSRPIPARGLEFAVDVYPTTVRGFAQAFQPQFELSHWTAVSVLAPPDDLPRLRSWIGPDGIETAKRWDARLRRVDAFAYCSEWLALTLRRRPLSL